VFARPDHGAIYGNVHGPLPFDEFWVDGCGEGADVDAEGSFFLLVPEGVCTLRVVARHDGWVAFGREVEVSVESGRDLLVTLLAPADTDLRPWSWREVASLRVQVAVARAMAWLAPEEPAYQDYLEELETLLWQAEAGQSADDTASPQEQSQ
jgi:hypothetical protein